MRDGVAGPSPTSCSESQSTVGFGDEDDGAVGEGEERLDSGELMVSRVVEESLDGPIIERFTRVDHQLLWRRLILLATLESLSGSV